jgi:hypothetical protein
VLPVIGAAPAATTADALEAVAAVNRAVATWLEGHTRDLAAAAAGHLEHLALHAGTAIEAAATATISTLALAPALGATGAAALGLAKAAGLIKLLVVTAEQEFLAAVGAGQSLVGKWHLESLLELMNGSPPSS